MAEEISPLENHGWWMEQLRKDAKANRPEALRLANLLNPSDSVESQAAAELRRLHDENEMLRKQRDEIFGALVQISLLTHLGGEVAEYGDVVDAVRRLHAVNQELLEALKIARPYVSAALAETASVDAYHAERQVDIAIAKATEEPK